MSISLNTQSLQKPYAPYSAMSLEDRTKYANLESRYDGLKGKIETSETEKSATLKHQAKKQSGQAECECCKSRKYTDVSSDPGVSFKTPQNISPSASMAAVSGHEQEHVVREQANARENGQKVVMQSVRLHSEICPECGKSFISGGTTTTVTAPNTGIGQNLDAYA